MKRRSIPALLALLIVLLCGCACEHEWTEADCLNPQVCSKCEEICSAALGHDWADASCTEPQTCLRCGETQGEALSHSFGDWSFSEDEMSHSCSVCSTEETSEIDRELYLSTLLHGHWDLYGMLDGTDFTSASRLSSVMLSLSFGENQTVTFTKSAEEVLEGTWAFDSYHVENSNSIYYFVMEFGDEKYLLGLGRSSDSEDMISLFNSEAQILFCQNQKAVGNLTRSWGIASQWGVAMGNLTNWLTFHEDRTVTGNLSEPFEGVWHLVPISLKRYGIIIECEKDGKSEILKGELSMENGVSVRMEANGLWSTFEYISQEVLTEIQTAGSIPLGTWTSILTSQYSTATGHTEESTTDYSITFNEDGTFTANLGREYSGIWILDSIVDARDDNWKNGNQSPIYYIHLYFEGQKDKVYCNLDARSEEIELTINNCPQVNGKNVVFGH